MRSRMAGFIGIFAIALMLGAGAAGQSGVVEEQQVRAGEEGPSSAVLVMFGEEGPSSPGV